VDSVSFGEAIAAAVAFAVKAYFFLYAAYLSVALPDSNGKG